MWYGRGVGRITKARIAAMIEEATVDAYGESEQATGFFTMIEQHLDLPFTTEVLGVTVTVAGVDLRGDRVVAVCTRAKKRLLLDLVELPLPSPRPSGSEWIEAYRHWRDGAGS